METPLLVFLKKGYEMRALISRHAAYGDIIHMSFLPHLLKDLGYTTVDVDTNFKGYQLLAHNPYIDKIFNSHPCEKSILTARADLMNKHYQVMGQEYDKFINLIYSIEGSCLAMEDDEVYYMSDAVRRKRFGDINFYDISCVTAGFPELVGKYKGEVYYTDDENKWAIDWSSKYKDKFVIMVNVGGTGPHKRFIQAPEFIEWVLKNYDDAIVIQTGDATHKHLEIAGNDRIESIIGKKPFRQALLMAKYANCVIGCESGLMVGADMWGTPTIQLLTAANHVNHCKYASADRYIQSPAYCSPCHKGPYQYIGCPHKDGNPLCVYFNMDDIKRKFEEIYVSRSSTATIA